MSDARGNRLTSVELRGRQVVPVRVSRQLSGEPERLILSLPGLGKAAPGDDRQLLVRLFGWAWSDQPTLRSIQHAVVWNEPARDLDLAHELVNMQAALRRCAPVPGRSVHFTRVMTHNEAGAESVRFSMHDPVTLQLTLEAIDDVDGLIVGVQLRDAFDRMLSGTRTDWQHASLPPLRSGERMLVDFTCPDMLLGPGMYQFTVAVSQDGREDYIGHWVDGAWRFEVISSGEALVVGLVDMGWRYARASTHNLHDVADLLPVRPR